MTVQHVDHSLSVVGQDLAAVPAWLQQVSAALQPAHIAAARSWVSQLRGALQGNTAILCLADGCDWVPGHETCL